MLCSLNAEGIDYIANESRLNFKVVHFFKNWKIKRFENLFYD